MSLIVENIHYILYVTGALTMTMFLQAVAPVKMMERTYGSAPTDANGLMIARHWGFMVGLSGLLLIAAGVHPEIRVPVLWFAIIGKAGYSTMILMRMAELKGKPAIMNAVVDIVMIALFVVYLVAV